MAQVIGELREDQATAGERLVYKKLKYGLPNDFYVYVEHPLNSGKDQRFPDFIVLTNFGVIVLEVKDWVEIVRATPSRAFIRSQGKERVERDPVSTARDYATRLAQKLKENESLLTHDERRRLDIPWGYAAILPNPPMSLISQLRGVWGESFVLGRADLEPQYIIKRLKATLPRDRNKNLTKRELDAIRATICPDLVIATPGKDRPAFVLDQEQEKIAMEPVRGVDREEEAKAEAEKARLLQAQLQLEGMAKTDEELPATAGKIAASFQVRLVRGLAGSGKTLVLERRAQYLAKVYPEWRIAVVTFNKELSNILHSHLKGIPNLRVYTFDEICKKLLETCRVWSEPHTGAEGWLNRYKAQYPIIGTLGAKSIADEIKWIKEVPIESREEYLASPRRGRARSLQRQQREQVYDVLEEYQRWLESQGAYDWEDVHLMVLRGLESGAIQPSERNLVFDAVLADEAQDFAPVWIRVIQHLLAPRTGYLFLADDPSQSIYRYFSWREKGVPVVGRTRWLRIPYRNTREIFQAAHAVIQDDEVLADELREEMSVPEDIGTVLEQLRSGERPQARMFSSPRDESDFIRREIQYLQSKGIRPTEMAVLRRRKRADGDLSQELERMGVKYETFHKLKGLEYDIVFLQGMQETFRQENPSPQYLSEERRLVYTAMTRARRKLYLTCVGAWPKPIEAVLQHVEKC